MCHAFHQVALAVEGSTMSGSLQRRKKSKRKWKRLWFLLKDKVLYTFTAREVRGHRVSHTSPKTLSHSHNHSITEEFPHDFCLSFFFFPSGQCSTELFNSHISTVQPFLLGRTLYVTNEGILCALSVSSDKYRAECRTALFSLKHLVIRISLLTARLVFLTCMPVFDVFALVSSG